MNAYSPVVEATETQRIEAALDALLRTATAVLREPSLRRDDDAVSVGDALRRWIDKQDNWTPAQRAADALLSRPVAEATRQAIRTLGERLHEIGGNKLMLDVLYRVAELDPANNARRIGIMDHRWDGIGDWTA